MAEVTERFADIHEGWLTLDITYDDVTLRVQTITLTANPPAGRQVYGAIFRGGNPNPWREQTFTAPGVFTENRPFGGGFNDLDQIVGHRFGWA